ncbi:MAG TPA: chromate transporter [Synergistaceae bacterium]|nr:chromate transporter [Synergistaceae bacterium]HQF91495.1 chromate transporter [Synergistaceae bacterium]HQH78334.1 chromate transporter [Synergistaceae bacterium]HQK24717.1 chromate transporter [Synergistaceae bacterium]
MALLGAIAQVFLPLSLMAFGGGNTIIAEIQRLVVDLHGWVTAEEFSGMYAISQAIPGPSMMIVTLLGLAAGGLGGALVSTIATFGPCSALVYALARQWDRAKDAPWRGAVERGLAPVAIGLIFAGGWALGREILDNPWEYAILALSTFVLARWNVNPLKLMVAVGTLALGAGILLGG